jgi:CRISP-associated protein Cas1
MSSIYVDEQGAVLHHRGNEILVEKDHFVIATLPLTRIDRIILAGAVQLSTQAMALFLKQNIPVSFISTHGDYRGRLTPSTGKNIDLRVSQYQHYLDNGFRLRFSRTIITAKIGNCLHYVHKFQRMHADTDLGDFSAGIEAELAPVERAATREILMGHEGVAARFYFAALGRMVRREFSFSGRSKRPPRDPINALLSLGYTLLFQEIVTVLETTGLDPHLGFLHNIDYGRASLAVDLCEEFRYLIDALVLALINRGELVQGDFREGSDSGWFLEEKGRKTFYAAYEHKIRTEVACNGTTMSYRRLFLHQAELLARVVKGEDAEYRPYLMR